MDLNKKINSLVKDSNVEEVVLTDDQKALLVSAWKNTPQDEPPKIKDLVNLLFPNRNLDGRSLEAKAIKQYLANYNLIPSSNISPPIIRKSYVKQCILRIS